MRFPLLFRSHHEEVVSLLKEQLAEARAAEQRLLNKLLRLSVGDDGEAKAAQPEGEVPAVQAEEEDEPESEIAEAVRVTGSTRWTKLRPYLERKRLRKGSVTAEVAAAIDDLEQTFEEGAQTQ